MFSPHFLGSIIDDYTTLFLHLNTKNDTIGTVRHTRSHHGKEDLDGQTLAFKSQQIVELVKKLQSVKTDTPQAKANETRMDDNNGRRIKHRGKKKHHQKASK